MLFNNNSQLRLMLRSTFILLVFNGFFLISMAQQLPDIQNTAATAPTGIRVDGKLLEWNSSFAAENKRTNVFYTLANDEKNIYLVLKSASQPAVSKIMLGGISMTFNLKGKKKGDEAFTITYPVIARNTTSRGGSQNRQRGTAIANEQSQAQRDSATLVQRRVQLACIKEIKLFGFEEITDSLISIYNEYGIKAAATIDDQGAYCYELAIPLKMLGISSDFSKEMAYRIRLNGRPAANSSASIINQNSSFGGSSRSGFGGGEANAARQELWSTTDFWGKYSLSKK